jgi:putative iron-dependent peroxidase
VPGLRGFPALCGRVAVPSTQQALWVMLRGDNRTQIFDRSQALALLIGDDFQLADCCDTFVYAGGRDLTGYEDGTENPQDDAAVAAALVPAGQPGLSGSSFVAVQRWVHDLRHFHGHSRAECDAMIGRQRESNEEMDDVPPGAHVKVAAQESYEPPAFMLRRSMPWAGSHEQGLEFIAYGKSFDAYERVLRRMTGVDGVVTDALFRFSRPVTGGYYWCPPIVSSGLDLSRLSL